MVIWVRRRPHARGVVGFVFLQVMFRLAQCAGAPRGTCNMRSLRCLLLQCAGVSNETCNIGYSCAVFCIAPMYRAGCPACRQFSSTWVACQVRRAQFEEERVSSSCQNSFEWCWTYRTHLPSGPASGPGKLSPCRLIGVRGRTNRRGVHGARRSTGTGSARWFLFPTRTWEPLLLTRVV